MSLAQNKFRLFRRLSVTTLVSVYLLILVGGIVRSTGSGMGCPDWPKCFGSWVPPTQVGQLPSDYKEIYSRQRAEKNRRFAEYLQAMGFAALAEEIKSDSAILEEADFNAAKTWTEYINRLIGALIGLLVLATFIASLVYIKKDNTIVLFSLLTVLTVGFQGWIGSIVVSTNLLPWMITVHMLLALVVVCLLTYIVVRSHVLQYGPFNFSEHWRPASRLISMTLMVAMGLTLLQIVMGAEVRESVNVVARTFDGQDRGAWVENLKGVFYIHRSFSLLILAIHVFLVYKVYHISGYKGNLISWSLVLLAVIILEILSGVVMAYFGIPRFAQPLHLLLAIVAFGLQFLLLLKLKSQQLFSSKVIKNLNEQHVSY